MLLDIVTLSRDISRYDSPRSQLHTCSLSLARVGFLRPRDADLQADTFELRCMNLGERRGDGVASSSFFFGSPIARESDLKLSEWA